MHGISRPDEPFAREPEPAPDEGETGMAGPMWIPVDEEGNVYGKSFRPSASDLASLVAVAEPVEAGDVLVIDIAQPGRLSLARQPADPGVFGIVAADPGLVLGGRQPAGIVADKKEAGEMAVTEESGEETAPDSEIAVEPLEVPVAVTGVVLCKVDAGYGPIRPGDLLTASPTRGHAMRADDPRPGTVLGKALEPLDTGMERIRVLVMLR